MNFRNAAALAGIAVVGQLLQAAPALASISADRNSTNLVVHLLSDAKSARLSLIGNDTAAARKDIDSAIAIRAKLVKVLDANGKSPVVQIYTELYENAALSYDFMVPARVPNQTRAGHIHALETTYLAIDLDKAKSRLDAAQHAVYDGDRQSAEMSLAAIRSDLVHGNDAADIPLLAARQALALAQRELRSNQPGAASASLQKASNLLNNYSSAGHGAAVHQLAADIRSSMRDDSQSESAISTRIDRWWTSVKSWFSHHS